MRPFLSLITILLVLSFGTLVNAQTSFSNTFPTNLSLGARNAQVTFLQRILNQDSDTRVANTGPGSPGNETDYFGLLTKRAVIRFQTKYASEVLTPAGLVQGSGYVGFYTRTKLNALSALTASTGSSATSIPVVGSPSISPVSTTASQNPNLKNIDKFLAALDKVGAQQGLSAEKLTIIKAVVMKQMATTTDLRATFLKQVAYGSQAIKDTSYVGKMLATIMHAFNTVFMPERARASDWSEGSNGSDNSTVPFGGALLETFFCEDSNTWLLTLEPLPPSYAVLLTYVPFSQAFSSYNIPVTNWLLGFYEPGAGACVTACPYCIDIPSEGMITPVVGSSPL